MVISHHESRGIAHKISEWSKSHGAEVRTQLTVTLQCQFALEFNYVVRDGSFSTELGRRQTGTSGSWFSWSKYVAFGSEQKFGCESHLRTYSTATYAIFLKLANSLIWTFWTLFLKFWRKEKQYFQFQGCDLQIAKNAIHSEFAVHYVCFAKNCELIFLKKSNIDMQ